MMKKVLSIVLVLTMIAALATGCAKAPADNGGSTNLTGSLADIVDKIYAAHPVDLSLGTENVDITDTAWMLPQFTGLTSAEGVKEAVVSEPMISSIAYSLVLVRVEDAKNAQSIAQQMKDGINPHKWVCVEADDLAVCGYGDVVMLIMVASDFAGDGITAQAMVDAFQSVCGGKLDFTL